MRMCVRAFFFGTPISEHAFECTRVQGTGVDKACESSARRKGEQQMLKPIRWYQYIAKTLPGNLALVMYSVHKMEEPLNTLGGHLLLF